MSSNIPESDKSPGGTEPAPESTTDEDILRLRSRLDREFAVVAQKLIDAEETLLDIELALRTHESGSRPRLPAPSAPEEKGTEKITSRLKAMGDGFVKIKEWVVKPGAKEGEADAAGSKGSGDLEDRLEAVHRSIALELRERERGATELDRKVHEAQKELIRLRANEQHARDMQVRIGQTKQMSEDLDRRMAMLDEMVRTFESSTKSDTGIRTKPKEQGPAVPKIEDRLQGAIDGALKAVTQQEKKLAEVEKELERAQTGLVEERTKQQRIRSMQIRLRQARHFSVDLQRSLAGLGASVEDLRRRAVNLLHPEARSSSAGGKAPARPPEAASKSSTS